MPSLIIFFKGLQKKWLKCDRRKDRLLAKHDAWFLGDIVVSVAESDGDSDGEGESDGDGEEGRQSRGSCGRPTKSFEELSSRSKRRASRDLARDHHTHQLVHAAKQSARAEKTSDLYHASQPSPTSTTTC